MLKKLCQNAGESITETLVATLIASFALILLAGMVSSSVSVVRTSKRTMSTYYESLNKMVKMEEPVAMTVQITSDSGSSLDVDVNGYMSSENPAKSVILYTVKESS